MKNMFAGSLAGLLLIAGLCAVSCTDGEFAGEGGGGNFIVKGLAAYEGQYVAVEGTSAEQPSMPVAFGPMLRRRVKISGGRVSAPLYTTGVLKGKYNGTSPCVYNFTIRLFEAESGGEGVELSTDTDVTVYPDGSALVDWR